MIRVRSPWTNRVIIFTLAALAAVCTAFFAPAWLRGTVRAVADYDAAAIVFLLGILVFVLTDDEKRTRTRAAMNDPGRNAVLLVTIASVAAGMAGAIVILGKGPDVQTPFERGVAVGLAITAATVGWLVTHATYALRYAHLFYRGTGDGLTFPKTPEPDDYDFLYFAFVIGMTFQVSDVQVNDQSIRRLVLIHGLMSFAYNTAILALGVNLISNLLH